MNEKEKGALTLPQREEVLELVERAIEAGKESKVCGGHLVYMGHSLCSCQICLYYKNGECHEKAPSAGHGWPKVKASDVCGKWTDSARIWGKYLKASNNRQNELDFKDFLEIYCGDENEP